MTAKALALMSAIAICGAVQAQNPGQNPPQPGMPGMPGGMPGGMPPGMMGGMPGMMPPGMGEETTATFLGIETSPVDPALRSQLKVPGESGLIINFVAPDSPAKSAGVERFDLLTKLDDQVLYNPPQLQSLIRGHKAGDEVKLTLIRQGEAKTLAAKLTEHKTTNPMMMGMPGMGMPQGMPMGGAMSPEMMGMRGMASLQKLVLEDGDTKIELKAQSGEVTLTATSKAGEKLYSGPIDTREQRDKLPNNVRVMLNDLAVDNLIQRMKEGPQFRRDGGQRDGGPRDGGPRGRGPGGPGGGPGGPGGGPGGPPQDRQ